MQGSALDGRALRRLPARILDHHIKHGDSLVGVFDLKVLKEGIPDGAYEPVTGDSKDAARAYKKRNTGERENKRQLELGDVTSNVAVVDNLAGDFQTLATLEEMTPDDVTAKEQLYEQLRHAPTWEKMKNACDLWTAAFFLPLEASNDLTMEGVPTTRTVRQLLSTNTVNGQLMGRQLRCPIITLSSTGNWSFPMYSTGVDLTWFWAIRLGNYYSQKKLVSLVFTLQK